MRTESLLPADSEPVVYLVDDDPESLIGLESLFLSVGLPVQAFGSAEEFLAEFDPGRPSCLVADVRMPGMTGIQLQQRLLEEAVEISLILVTGHAEVAMAVDAMQAGAIDFIQKPLSPNELLNKVQAAIDTEVSKRQVQAARADIGLRLDSLSRRESEVMELLVGGDTSKEIAHQLGIRATTVDFHRGNILAKMQVSNVVLLARLVDEYRSGS